MTGYIGVLATFVPKPTQIIISCNPTFYSGIPVGHVKCGVLHLGTNNPWLTCHAISASAELLVCTVTASLVGHSHSLPLAPVNPDWFHTHTHTQPFYGSLDFVQDYAGQLAPER